MLSLLICLAHVSDRLILWDGDRQKIGVGWVSPNTPQLSIGEVHERRSKAFRWHAAKPNVFVECGWQWAPWFPTFAGTDLAGFNRLEIDVRLEGPKPPPDLLASLASPGDHQTTTRVSLTKLEGRLYDGKWHHLAIPFASFTGSDSRFDSTHATQLILGAWNGADGDFSVTIDNLVASR